MQTQEFWISILNRKAFCSLKIVQYNAKNDFSQPPAAQIFDIASLTSERLIL